MYKIDKDIGINDAGPSNRYPFNIMDIGDSVLFEENIGEKARNAARKFNIRSNKRFVSKKVDGGIRVWRIE